MSTVTKKVTSYDYGWDSLAIDETHFKFRRDMQRTKDAWKKFQRHHPELTDQVVEFQATRTGVVYRRVR